MNRRWWWVALSGAFAILAIVWLIRPNDRHVGQTVLRIPSDVSVGTVPLWLRMIPGLDNNAPEILLTVPADKVAASIKGYSLKDGDVTQDQTLLVADLNEHEQAEYRTHKLMRDFVIRKGRYAGATITQIPNLGVWKVDAGGGLFDLFVHDPKQLKSAEAAQKNWMGTCQEMELVVTASGKDWLCNDYIVSGRLRIGFHYGLKNLLYWSALRRYLGSLVSGWVVVRPSEVSS